VLYGPTKSDNHNGKLFNYIYNVVLPLAGFSGLVLLYFYPFLSSEQIFSERDLAPFFIPPKILWVHLVKGFTLPFWNPYNYSGIPLLATLQPGIFYPPHLLYFILPFNVAWNWLIILHFIFTGMSSYVFLRYIRVSRLSAFLGGTVLILSGYLVSVHNLLPHLFAVAWFPLIVLFYLKHIETRKRKYIVLSSMFLVFQFCAGAPEIVLLTVVVLFVVSFHLKAFIVEIDLSWLAGIKALSITILLFLFLAGIQWLPFYELKTQSIRTSGLSYRDAITWSFAWKDFIQFFLPDVFGYLQTTEKYWQNQSWLKTVYIGLAPICFSILYFLSKDRRRIFFASIMMISLVFALGGNTPIYNILYKIPPFNAIRYPVKFLFLLFFGISATTALGLDILRGYFENKDKKIQYAVQAFFYVGFLFALLWGYFNFYSADVEGFFLRHGLKPPLYNEVWFNIHNIKRFLLFSFLFCSALFLYFKIQSNKLKNVILFAVLFVSIFDLFLANYGFFSSVSWKWFTAREGLVKEIPSEKETGRYFVTVKTEREFQNVVLGKSSMSAPYASMYGLHTVGGSEVMRVESQDTFLRMFSCFKNVVEAERLLDIGGIKYVIISYEINNKDFKLIKKEGLGDNDAYLYEYKRYPGRFLFFNNIRAMNNSNEAIAEMVNKKDIDFKRELIIVDKSVGNLRGERQVRGKVTVVSYKPNKAILNCETDQDAFLYVSDTWYPGWRAYVDGKETKIYRANLAFRAVEVPKGKHTVVFKYVPMSFYIGLCLTIIGILLCIYLWRRDGTTVNRKS
jgi:hypothetical protein